MTDALAQPKVTKSAANTTKVRGDRMGSSQPLQEGPAMAQTSLGAAYLTV
jgi:hypothetical protein